MRWLPCTCGVFLLLTLAAGAQSPDPASEVHLLVTVLDKRGEVVADLKSKELLLKEENKPQTVLSLKLASDTPRTVALLLDVSRSREEIMPGAECAPARAFLRRVLSPNALGMVVAFDRNSEIAQELTDNTLKLESVVQQVCRRAPKGSTAFLEAVEHAAESRLNDSAGTRSIVVVSDGHDNNSKVKLNNVIQKLQRYGIRVYVVRLASRIWKGPMEREAARLTRTLSEQTGGLTVEVRDPGGFEVAFNAIADAIENSFVLTYRSTNEMKDGAFRRIKLESTRKGMRILTRKGYYAPKS